MAEKGIGISYPIGKLNKNQGGYTDGERIPQGTAIGRVIARVIAGRAYRPAAGAIRQGEAKLLLRLLPHMNSSDKVPGITNSNHGTAPATLNLVCSSYNAGSKINICPTGCCPATNSISLLPV